MTGEAILFNPRGHKRRRKKATSRRRVKRHRGRFVRARSNPGRRRLSSHRRALARRGRGRRRVHRNPLGGLTRSLGGAAMTGIGVAGGVVATNLATSFIVARVPGIPAMLTSGPGKLALKGIVGVVALPMLLKAVKQPGLARNVAIGAWAAIILDAYSLWIAPQLAAAGLPVGEYEELSDYGDGEDLAVYEDDGGIGAGENIYGDTIY